VILRRGQSVVTEGEADGAVYLVTSGKVKISRRTTSGGEGLLALLGPGQVFGELSLLDGAPRSASARAVTGATVQELTQERLHDLLRERPEIAHWMLQQLARRLRHTNDVVAELVFSDVPSRMAQILVNLAREFGVDAADGVQVEHGLTQLELAQLAGAARESVNKALASFVNRDWVTLSSRSVVIHDLEALRRRAG
jgi:CRP/FNR family cyclic AMP-dependent transcriptional regulator